MSYKLTCVLLIVASAACGTTCACTLPDWTKAVPAYQTFLGQPSEKNARAVLDVIPPCTVEYGANDLDARDDFSPDIGLPGRDHENYRKLLALAESGNVGAIQILFRLEWLFDAEQGETLGVDIGKVSDARPRDFLVAYSESEGTVRDLDGDITALGPEYVDDFPAQIKKLKKRYAALKATKGAPPRAKEECLRVIRKWIEALQQMERQSKSQP